MTHPALDPDRPPPAGDVDRILARARRRRLEGPAYPVTSLDSDDDPDETEIELAQGLSRAEWIATQLLAAMVARPDLLPPHRVADEDHLRALAAAAAQLTGILVEADLE